MQFSMKNYADFQTVIDALSRFLEGENIPDERVFDSKLVACELLGNVLQHSGGSAVLIAEIEEELIRLCVRAEKKFSPKTKGACPDAYAERGRGLFLVDSVSESRITTPEGDILVHIRIADSK